MTRRRQVLAVAFLLASATATASAVVLIRRPPPAALYDDGGRVGNGYAVAHYDEFYSFGLGPFRNVADDPVRFVSARFLDVTPGFTVREWHAVDLCDGRSDFIMTGGPGSIHRAFPDTVLHPLSDAVLAPHGKECWYVLVYAGTDRPGAAKADRLEITYRVGSRLHRQVLGYGADLVAQLPGPDPAKFRPADLSSAGRR